MLDLGRTLLYVTEREPSATAIIDGDTTLTYGEWLERTLRTVTGLDAIGLGRGDHLVTILQNRLEAATLHWACQLAGVVITPVNWRAKPEELDYVLDDSGARAVCYEPVSADAVANAPHARDIHRIAVGGAGGGTVGFDDLSGHSLADAASRAGPDDISVMLYTSGTTGRPKGVPRTHAAERTAALAHVAQNRYGYGERTLGVMPLYHTMGVRSLLSMALVSGGFVCQARFETSGALDLIGRHRVTNLYLVPTLYHDLLADPAFESSDVSSVRKLGFAGAPMTDGLLRRLSDAFRPELFVNHYGSSEIYTFTVCPDAPAKPGSAGKAGINQRIRVVRIGGEDPNDTMPPNEEGEIIASLESDESFTGYWRRPEADAKSLRAGWYFTGDVGYFDVDGDLFVTGRVDDMMISGGENVMPVEIESVLSLHPGVAEVAVAGLPDERLGQRVTAFVTRRTEVDADTLDAYCKASALADFKRPRAYVFVRSIPKSPVGKILRRMLLAGEYEVE
ncbi:MAG: AMP-binding protein [Gammaproteobacteria bacterium]|nr:AMP-binding protein [Gammaproteobacteria bacterium]